MNAKKAKALRRIARQSGLVAEDVYLQNINTGAIRVGKCQRGLVKHLKKKSNVSQILAAAAAVGR